MILPDDTFRCRDASCMMAGICARYRFADTGNVHFDRACDDADFAYLIPYYDNKQTAHQPDSAT